MKTYIKLTYFLFAVLVVLLGACSTDDRIFESQGQERLEEQIAKIDADLKSAKDGWIMRYYPDETRVGGYVFLMNFSENTVKIQSDFNNEIEETEFKIYGGEGPVLSFSEYNTLHVLADPAVPPYGIGYGGDFEFVVINSSPKAIELKGRKWDKKVTLEPATPEDWETISTLRDNETILAPVGENVPFYRNVYVNGTPIATFLYQSQSRFLEYFYKDENNQLQSGSTGVSFTKTGFELQKEITINGAVLKEFSVNDMANGFTFEGNGELKIENSSVIRFDKAWEKIFNHSYLALQQISPDFGKLYEAARTVQPDFRTILLFWQLSANYIKSLSFVFDNQEQENRNLRYYHTAIRSVENPDEDQAIFNPSLNFMGDNNYYLGGDATVDELNTYFVNEGPNSEPFKEITELFFTEEGFTIIPTSDGNYYLISNQSSSYWLLFTPSN